MGDRRALARCGLRKELASPSPPPTHQHHASPPHLPAKTEAVRPAPPARPRPPPLCGRRRLPPLPLPRLLRLLSAASPLQCRPALLPAMAPPCDRPPRAPPRPPRQPAAHHPRPAVSPADGRMGRAPPHWPGVRSGPQRHLPRRPHQPRPPHAARLLHADPRVSRPPRPHPLDRIPAPRRPPAAQAPRRAKVYPRQADPDRRFVVGESPVERDRRTDGGCGRQDVRRFGEARRARGWGE